MLGVLFIYAQFWKIGTYILSPPVGRIQSLVRVLTELSSVINPRRTKVMALKGIIKYNPVYNLFIFSAKNTSFEDNIPSFGGQCNILGICCISSGALYAGRSYVGWVVFPDHNIQTFFVWNKVFAEISDFKTLSSEMWPYGRIMSHLAELLFSLSNYKSG